MEYDDERIRTTGMGGKIGKMKSEEKKDTKPASFAITYKENTTKLFLVRYLVILVLRSVSSWSCSALTGYSAFALSTSFTYNQRVFCYHLLIFLRIVIGS
jgi:hypothetical protein